MVTLITWEPLRVILEDGAPFRWLAQLLGG